MSDTWGKLKEVKGLIASIIAGAIVVMAIGGAIMEWRISVNVAAALSAQDLATDSNIMTMNTEIDANEAHADANTTRIAGNERRVELAFAALMGRPPPEDNQ